jgi:hypothetical protein
MSEELFYCSCCGQCCKRIDKVVKNFEAIFEKFPDMYEEFPYSWSESGVCEMLDQNNKCKCYDTRPIFCDSARFLEELNKRGVGIDRDEFIKVSLDSCQYLQGKPMRCSKNSWKVVRKR